MHEYRVKIEIVGAPEDPMEDETVTVKAVHRTHAGVVAREEVAKRRGEEYDPERFKVVTILRVD